MTIETVGVDIAKNVFQLHGVNCNGRVVLKPARGRFSGRGISRRLGIRSK